MLRHLNQSLSEAFELLDNEEEMLPVEQEMTPQEDTSNSLEERVSELETEINTLKNSLVNKDVLDEFEVNTSKLVDSREDFENKVYECFMKQSGLYKKPDVEITEELLDKRPYKDAFIPSVATKKRISRDAVRNILLNRSKGSDNEVKDK